MWGAVVLIQRIYAMYNCDKRLLVFLSLFLVVQVITETAVTGPLVIPMKRRLSRSHSLTCADYWCTTALHLPPQFPGCVPVDFSPHMWAYWVPLLSFQTVLFVLAMAQVLIEARREWNTPKLLVVMLRDSLVYFGGMLAIILANVMIWATARVCCAILPSFKAHGSSFCTVAIVTGGSDGVGDS